MPCAVFPGPSIWARNSATSTRSALRIGERREFTERPPAALPITARRRPRNVGVVLAQRLGYLGATHLRRQRAADLARVLDLVSVQPAVRCGLLAAA
jgi:hypothetical protein